ncbi:MAG: thiamine-phosphate kinase [Arcobacter sp.]|uniref:thiamine-phosphate kinase n=1 Tax=Arcobacter sp. TaxID=1872629 RepID=UPI003C740B27
MNKEDFFIKQFKNTHKNIIGDDGAVVGSHVYSMDAFFENVHFKRDWMSLKDIARKAMIVNISDAIVMNAIPKYALISIAIPKDFSKDDLKELANGFKNIAKKFGIKIIGGDTISNIKLDISITIISKTKKPIFRKGLKKDDFLCYTGELGTCKKDLKSLLQGKEVSKKSKFIKPKLKPEFFYEISPYVNCALDISDGLFFELERLSETNNLGFDFFDKISKDIGCSGEEYEILFSFCAKKRDIISKIAKKHKVKLNIFAKAVDGTYKGDCQNHHFN